MRQTPYEPSWFPPAPPPRTTRMRTGRAPVSLPAAFVSPSRLPALRTIARGGLALPANFERNLVLTMMATRLSEMIRRRNVDPRLIAKFQAAAHLKHTGWLDPVTQARVEALSVRP